jgi:tetratricopeptide (TPR) repeat protein
MHAMKFFLIFVALCSALPALAAGDPAHQALLQSARLWELRQRDDLAAAALEKLLLVNPTDVDTILALGLLRIHENKMEQANNLVDRLQKLQPGGDTARQLADAYRVATRDRLKMATVRRLAQSNQTPAAIKAIRELFPDGAPPAELGIEYFQLIGQSPESKGEARQGLTNLTKQYPEDPRYRLALAKFLSREETTRAEAKRLVAALERDPEADQEQVKAVEQRVERKVSSQANPNSSEQRAARLRKEGDAALADDQERLALMKLDAALSLNPNDPWLRFSLAKLYLRLGLPSEARSLMAQGVTRAPKDADALYAQALMLSSLDDEAAALASLEKIPVLERSAGMMDMEARLRVGLWRKQAQQLAASGDAAGAQNLLEAAAAHVGKNPMLVGGLAQSWVELGQADRGAALMRARLGDPTAAHGDALLEWAEFLNRLPDDVQLESLLPRLQSEVAASSDAAETVKKLQTSILLRKVYRLRDIGQYDQALVALDAPLQQQPENARLLDARGEVLASSGDGARAVAIYRELVKRNPGDLNLLLSYAWSLRLNGEREASSRVLDDVQQRAASSDVSTQLSLVRQRLSLDQPDRARQLVQNLLKIAPQNPSVLVQAGRVESAERNYELAMDYFRRARALEERLPPRLAPGQTQTAAEEEIGRLEQRRDGFITAGLNPRDKPGDPGVSQFKEMEIPVELVVPVGYEAHLFAHLDTVRLDAGTLPAVYNDAAFYGKVQAFGPASLANFPNGSEQKADGVAIGLGYETDSMRVDLGSTPIGFPVVDVVGGVKYYGSWGAADYSVDLSRRPVTSSLLAYAGARDPVTGAVWGGVRSSGLDTRIARDFGRLGTAFSAGFHRLSGRNVKDNNYLSARGVVDWLFINREDTRLSVGLALAHWRYSENLSGYTFGQGGYYSPQTYTSVSLPVDWRGRWGRWSYRLRPGVSFSQSTTKDSPFYPTSNALQTMAETSPLPPGYTRPVFDGGSGTGVGYSLKAALEYQVLPDYFLGASYDIDRSQYYAPNSTLIYFRHVFQDWTRPVPYPPRPPRSYADF